MRTPISCLCSCAIGRCITAAACVASRVRPMAHDEVIRLSKDGLVHALLGAGMAPSGCSYDQRRPAQAVSRLGAARMWAASTHTAATAKLAVLLQPLPDGLSAISFHGSGRCSHLVVLLTTKL